ncbi:hypothetical protein HYV89_00745 [Candidatus Woesearchaeota archaeon]|nr:hypothetical protein [Candidatus Woesearchaeota archaeon]
MKKIFFFGIIVIILFLISGAGCNEQKTTEKVQINDGKNNDVKEEGKVLDIVKDDFEEGRILVDRVRYVQAGNPPFDFTNVIFHQKSGNGYRAEINSDKDIKAEVMTEKDCLLKGQGDKYSIIKEDEGKKIIIAGEKNEGENRNLCVGATSKEGSGQVEIKFKVVELI